MPEAFDAYFKWLGIDPEDQPPNHYRLLGIKLFQSDPDVIANSADKQMAHIRSFQTGQYSALSQKILNEIAAARICLLNAAKKAKYDEQLRRELVASEGQPQQTQAFDASRIGLDLTAEKAAPVVKRPRHSHGTKLPWQLPAAIVAGLLASVAIIAYLISSKSPEGEKPRMQARADTSPKKTAEAAKPKDKPSKPEARPEPKRETKPEPKPEPEQPEARPAAEPEPKPEPEPEVQPEPKPELVAEPPEKAAERVKDAFAEANTWKLVFRSANPEIWNTDVENSKAEYAIPIARVPDDIRYLKLQIDKTRLVIIPITKERLLTQSAEGRFGWQGTSRFQWGGYHLGVYDLDAKGIRASVSIANLDTARLGWGFGHRNELDDRQAYSWAGVEIPKAVFEISVKSVVLARSEQEYLVPSITPKSNGGEFSKTDFVGGAWGNEFEDLSDPRCLLVGFHCTSVTPSGKTPVVKSIQPIYLGQLPAAASRAYGKAEGEMIAIEAKKGYAVGGIVAKGGNTVDGFKVVFMRVGKTSLDTNDSYESAWIGGHGGGDEKKLGGDGRPVIGIYGKSGGDLNRLGLIQAEKPVESLGAAAPVGQLAKVQHKPALKQTARIGGKGGKYFEEGNAAARLIGLSVTTRNFAGHDVIGSVQAIYQNGRNKVTGEIHGNPNGKPVVLVAKPGFAVGGIIAIGGDRLDGFQIVFMRSKGNKLDPTQVYQSDWVGGGRAGTRLGCDGNPVVGIFGGTGAEVDGVGLIQFE